MSVLTNASDTYVDEGVPTKPFGTVPKIRLSSGARTRFGLIYFARPVNAGENVLSGKLRLWSGDVFEGTVTVSLRRLAAGFKVNKVNWNTRPATVGVKVATVQKTGAGPKTLWEFNVKDLLDDLAAGAEWFGLRIESNTTDINWFYSAEGPEEYRPQLDVVTSENPEIATELYPRNNVAVSVPRPTLRWRFTDRFGDKTMQSLQVKVYATKANADAATSPLFDSTKLARTESIYDLDDALISRVVSVSTTLNSTNVTGAAGAFSSLDASSDISGPGIPAGTTVTQFVSDTSLTISAPATATATVNATISRVYSVAVGETVWWTAQHWDGAGLPSPVSEPAQFHRTAKQAAAWTTPTTASPVVNDPTPPFAWTFPDQKAFRFQILDPLNPAAQPFWDSGELTSTDRFVTPDKGLPTPGKQYLARLYLWDSVVRANLPDDTPYVLLEILFTYEFSATVAAPSSIDAQVNPTVDAWVDVLWSRTTAPDEFIIYRNNVGIERGPATDYLIAGANYKFTDRLADPRRDHEYKVVAMVNGVASAAPPVDVIRIVPKTTVLSTLDGTRVVSIWDPARSGMRGEDSELHRLLGDAPPVLIVSALRDGREDKIAGTLVDDFGVSIDTQRGHLEWFRKHTGTELCLTSVDKSMRVVAYNLNYDAVARHDGSLDYDINFDYFEV